MKWAGLCIYLLALANTACAAGPVRSEPQLLRSYAVAQCVAKAYPGTEVASDAKATAAGYLEFGYIDVDAYSDAVKLAENALRREYHGKNGENLHLMKCIDLVFSPDLDAIVQKYAIDIPLLKK